MKPIEPQVGLHFMMDSTLITPETESYRPPSFPPPDDWVITVDEQGKPLSRYGDLHWDYSAFGFRGFNFGNHNLSDGNLRLVKQALLFVIYFRLFPGKIQSCDSYFVLFVKIAKVCDQHGILINELSQYPAIHPVIASELQDARCDQNISFLHKLLQLNQGLGFVIADKKTISFFASQAEGHEAVQCAYIPPRIWSYQLNRLDECLEDFLAHQPAIKIMFDELSRVYEYNIKHGGLGVVSPFGNEKFRGQMMLTGTFDDFLKRYGLFVLMEKWIAPVDQGGKYMVTQFAKYLTFIRDVAIYYLANYSLQRSGEASSMRSDCFQTEKDNKLGPIGLLIGETTKTDPDSDARWVVPMRVEKAVEVALTIARWRMRHCPPVVSYAVRQNPYLLTPAWEPWSARGTKGERVKSAKNYGLFLSEHMIFFDPKEITVTEEDWKIAVSLTPNLDQNKGFGVGKPWVFSLHQLRRTTCVNMFASDMVSDSSLQWQLKHLERDMTMYYGRNYTKLRLNGDAEMAVIKENYLAIYRQLCDVVKDTVEYVRPHENEMIPDNIIQLVDVSEEKKLIKLIKKGVAGCRRTLLGYCMKNGACEYGGIESVAKCAGTGGKGICADAIFARKNKTKLIKLKEKHQRSLEKGDKHSPQYSAAMQEIYAIEVYLNVVSG